MIKQRSLPVQTEFNQPRRRLPFVCLGSDCPTLVKLGFQEPEPDQWSENASLHGTETEVPLRLQHADHGRCTKPRERLSQQPVVCRRRKRPQDDTHFWTAGTYTFEIAEQKQCEVLLMAKIEEHPLLIEVERA
jgi:hypothetical protein